MERRLRYQRLTDSQVTDTLTSLACKERKCTAAFVCCLAEFDCRRIDAALGFPSIYTYCQEVLRLSEDAAYKRVVVARAVFRHPAILDMLDDGRLSLTTACMIIKAASPDALDGLLLEAAYMSKRQTEVLLAARYPRPAVASVVAPLSASHYKLQVSISVSARERLQRIQELMRHKFPDGDPAAIVEYALELLHAELLKRKGLRVTRPRARKAAAAPRGRYIPVAVRREVWRRDRSACAFIAPNGHRCGSRDGLELHHLRPYAVGGDASASNIELRCRRHNRFEWGRHLDDETAGLVSRGK
jgi:hypothetical protein